MSRPVTIFGLAGSLRAKSYNRAALRAAGELLPEGATLDAMDLPDLPGFNEDREKTPPPEVVEMKRRIRAADAVLLVTPEYNYSMPGVLKNAIDWVSRPYGDNAWGGKPGAIMSASMGTFGGARAQYHLRQCFIFLDLKLVNWPEVAIPGAHKAFDADGKLVNEMSRKFVGNLMETLVAWTRQLRGDPK
jgi:chromate reductase, NAD(P)H dehydrogenase (quinone)